MEAMFYGSTSCLYSMLLERFTKEVVAYKLEVAGGPSIWKRPISDRWWVVEAGIGPRSSDFFSIVFHKCFHIYDGLDISGGISEHLLNEMSE